MAGRGRQRTSFAKLQRERARQEKQAAKRAKRHGVDEGGIPQGPAPAEPSLSETRLGGPESEA
jgi:hypothetical protein